MNIKRFGFALLGATTLMATSASNAHELNFTGSIPLKNAKAQQIPRMAKLTVGDAIIAASKEIKGNVVEAMLGDENGFLVYTVGVATEKNALHHLVIDAGNGQVLAHDEEAIEDHQDGPDAQ